jgi:superfamily I DNA and RNA helicase
MIVIRGETNKPESSQILADYFEARTDIEGCLYLGYPIIGAIDSGYPIDALILSKQQGAIIFHLIDDSFDESINIGEIQDESFTKLELKLKQHKELIKKTYLDIELNVVTFAPSWAGKARFESESKSDVTLESNLGVDYPILVTKDDLDNYLNSMVSMEDKYYEKLLSIIHPIKNINYRQHKHNDIENSDSKGAKLKKSEDSIANLDRQQSVAVIETVDGVQRIRGIAGSGKTIVLASKVAYLHAKHPNWNIAVTFKSHSLKEQFKYLITQITLEFINSVPNWGKIKILQAWGSPSSNGLYYEFCLEHNVEYLDFRAAKDLANSSKEIFDAACKKAFDETQNFQQYYDAILVDEAHDLPPVFLKLCYKILKEPKRLIYAYDELQNLDNKQMPSPEDLFALEDKNQEKFKQDIVLNTCHRNSKAILVTAHALGFGLYTKKPLVPMPAKYQFWKDMGYEIKTGRVANGEKVTLKRQLDSSHHFSKISSSIDDLIDFKAFKTDDEQISYLVAEIEKNIKKDELKPNDIMVIYLKPDRFKNTIGKARAKLFNQQINSSFIGFSTNFDSFFIEDVVTFTSIYGAKSNEAAMVYIINAHECLEDDHLPSKGRNMLFTALMRSKAWVSVLGYGENMQALKAEFELIKENNFELKFTYPTIEEPYKQSDLMEKLLEGLKKGSIKKESLPKELKIELKEFL